MPPRAAEIPIVPPGDPKPIKDASIATAPYNLPMPRRVGQPAPPPTAHPPFTLSDIHAAIPKHCFERNLFVSLGYIVVDAVIIFVAGFGVATVSSMSAHPAAMWAAWAAYWMIAGNTLTGVWIIAHECGHGAFSTSKLINNTVGTILHSALLVPYHPWRISHSQHHKYCCSIDDDMAFVPSTRSALQESLGESPIAILAYGIWMMVAGWPLYFCFNTLGPAKLEGKVNDHYRPWSAFLEPHHFWLVVQSDLALLCVLGTLAYACSTVGVWAVAAYYLVPYLIVNANLVVLTYLQHTDTYVPHYRSGGFTPMRGKLATVDRDVGILNYMWHHITDTHVLHHIDHHIPHYHAQEATEAIKPLLGDYYLFDSTPWWTAFYSSLANCQYVPEKGDYVYYVGPANDPAKTD